VIEVIYLSKRLRVSKIIVLILVLSLTGLVTIGSLLAQLRKDEVNFEVLATVTMKKGDALWNLAQKYYKNGMKWKYIAEMNRIPNEKRIPVGTVIYIPVEDAKIIAKEAEKEVEVKKAVVDETALKLAALQEELDKLKKDYEDCAARCKELAAALKEKDDLIAQLQGQIKDLKDQLAAQAELEAQLDDMRVASKAVADRESELARRIAEKEAGMAEMEWKLKAAKEEAGRFERETIELKDKIKKIEEMGYGYGKVKRPSDPRSRVAAIAIALVGSIIWMASKE